MTQARKLILTTLLSTAIVVGLSGCAAALVGATAVGISAATDTRSVGTQLDDQTIEIRTITALKGEDRLDNSRVKVNYRRSEEHTSELQSRPHLVCRLLLEKKKKK